MSELEGNAKPQVKVRKQTKFWKCNYHLKSKNDFDKYFELIEQVFAPICETYIFAEEYGNSGKTPHIEGYLIFFKKSEFQVIQKLFKWSDLRASNKKMVLAGIEYCSKEGNKIVSNLKDIPKPLVKMEYHFLRQDQKDIVDLFKVPEDALWGRKIHWFWEPWGAWGKSVVAIHMIDFMGAYMVSGKGTDIKCGLSDVIKNSGSCPPIIIIDVPRSNKGFISYQAIEEIKNGCMFSGKFESGMVRFNRPHIIIFSNDTPEEYKMSNDRWIIKRVDGKTNYPAMSGDSFLEMSDSD